MMLPYAAVILAALSCAAAKPNAILYGLSLCQSDSGTPKLPSYEDQFDQVKVAGYETLVLWSWHISNSGDIYYNDSPCVVNGTFQVNEDGDKGMNVNYTRYINTMKDSGVVKEIYLSIGDDDPSDFENYMSNIEVATANFKVLLDELPAVDGFDFDYEGDYDENTILTMTHRLGVNFNKSITYCPYTDELAKTPAAAAEAVAKESGFWLPVLAKTYKTFKYQPVKRMNLQCYAGGGGNTPALWIDQIKQYPGGLKALGLKDANSFVAPGYWAQDNSDDGQCPGEIEATFQSQRDANITGGFLWNSEGIFLGQAAKSCPGEDQSLKAFANAVIKGIGK